MSTRYEKLAAWMQQCGRAEPWGDRSLRAVLVLNGLILSIKVVLENDMSHTLREDPLMLWVAGTVAVLAVHAGLRKPRPPAAEIPSKTRDRQNADGSHTLTHNGITANVTGAAEVQAFLQAVPFGADAVRKALAVVKEGGA